MHLRAALNGILTPITYLDLTPGKLEAQLKKNPPTDPFIGQKGQATNSISKGRRKRVMTTDPRIRALAKEAAALIKTLTNANNAQIEAIYRDFRTQADAIQAEASTKSLTGSGADLLPKTEVNESQEINQL